MTKTRILLADDHDIVRSGIRNALRDLPYLEFVGEVGDGPSLAAMLAQQPVDCLLLDVTMPNFEPISAIRQIRAQYPDIKILIISAYDDDTYVQGLLSEGVNGYHLKDQPLNDLRLAVKRVLDGEKWISSRLLDKLVHYTNSPQIAPTLTNRQREILRHLQQGLDNQSIARKMNLSVKTIENHLTRLYRQLNVQSRLEAVNYVRQHPEILATSNPTPKKHIIIPPKNNPKQASILVVDDNSRYRHQLQRMVGKIRPDALIYEAETIKEAVAQAQHISPKLVLVDVVLGDEDGIHCTRRIKIVSPKSRIILISAYPDREFHRRGLEAGAIAFLDKKDLDTKALRQVVNDILA